MTSTAGCSHAYHCISNYSVFQLFHIPFVAVLSWNPHLRPVRNPAGMVQIKLARSKVPTVLIGDMLLHVSIHSLCNMSTDVYSQVADLAQHRDNHPVQATLKLFNILYITLHHITSTSLKTLKPVAPSLDVPLESADCSLQVKWLKHCLGRRARMCVIVSNDFWLKCGVWIMKET